jgi:hypothetical protein
MQFIEFFRLITSQRDYLLERISYFQHNLGYPFSTSSMHRRVSVMEAAMLGRDEAERGTRLRATRRRPKNFSGRAGRIASGRVEEIFGRYSSRFRRLIEPQVRTRRE